MPTELVAEVYTTSTISTISVSSLPQDGKDLLVVLSLRHTGENFATLSMTANFDSSNIYNWKAALGDGTDDSVDGAASASAINSGRVLGHGTSGNNKLNTSIQIYIPNYAEGGRKYFMIEHMGPRIGSTVVDHSWRNGDVNLSAISALSFSVSGNSIEEECAFSVYKIY